MKLKCVAVMLIVILAGLFPGTLGYCSKPDNEQLWRSS